MINPVVTEVLCDLLPVSLGRVNLLRNGVLPQVPEVKGATSHGRPEIWSDMIIILNK